MRLAFFGFGAMVSVGIVLVACNAVLGIGEASLSQPDAGSPAATTQADAENPDLTCSNYCALMADECTGQTAEYIPGQSAVCQELCGAFRTTTYGVVDDTINLGPNYDPSVDASTADTLNCRLWHVNFAIEEKDPTDHCPHAGPLGGRKCGDPCEAFCQLDTTFCAGDASAYPGGMTECLNACRPDAGGYPGFPYAPGDPEAVGVAETTTGNTLECRMYHLEAALDPTGEGKSYHCPHTSQKSTPNTCGNAASGDD